MLAVLFIVGWSMVAAVLIALGREVRREIREGREERRVERRKRIDALEHDLDLG